MKAYKEGYWIWKCDLDKLKRILLTDAQNETSFTKWCITEAIENKKRAATEFDEEDDSFEF